MISGLQKTFELDSQDTAICSGVNQTTCTAHTCTEHKQHPVHCTNVVNMHWINLRSEDTNRGIVQ